MASDSATAKAKGADGVREGRSTFIYVKGLQIRLTNDRCGALLLSLMGVVFVPKSS